ncbi:RNA-binding S4 domain-containing protein [Synechococcus sp. UW140]|uniref:RNA-binding S4 domain-containing protein n=1 Tax=Synechococcus sp. UW140 TaxID=368503 RepID=UPI000E0FC1EB|nr:RNA-binding S4 domain-containing protein [Synechococcus sp. UW140]
MRLDQFLKWQGWVATGGEAKMRIQAGDVQVNDVVETRRGLQLQVGDRVTMGCDQAEVTVV